MLRKIFLAFLLLFAANLKAFDKVVIWGFKLHSHTHSYIHYGFFRAFKHLGYKTYWFDDNDDCSKIDFSNALFLTIGGQENNIPIRGDCYYILHNCDNPKYATLLEKNQAIKMQVFTNAILRRNATRIDNCIYYNFNSKTVIMPWATDLLPHEIDGIKQLLKNVKRERKTYWVGTIGGGEFGNESELAGFRRACSEAGIEFVHFDPWSNPLSPDDNRDLIMKSYIAPAIVGEWQKNAGYIPCRIFKNISYGQMGVTNSKSVSDLFEGKIVYNPNTYKLFFDVQKRMKTYTLEDQYEIMDFVKAKHTYLNRIQTLLQMFEELKARTK